MKKLNRIAKLKEIINSRLENESDFKFREEYMILADGLASVCAAIAMKRGISVELAMAMALLVDIYSYRTGNKNLNFCNSEEEARVILKECELFNEEEEIIIRRAIFKSEEIHKVQDPFDELLKDGRIVYNFINNINQPIQLKEMSRLRRTLKECNLEFNLKICEDKIEEGRRYENQRVVEIAENLVGLELSGEHYDNKITKYFLGKHVNTNGDLSAIFVHYCINMSGLSLPIKYYGKVGGLFSKVGTWIKWANLEENSFYYPVEIMESEVEEGDIVVVKEEENDIFTMYLGIVKAIEDEVIYTVEVGKNDNIEECIRKIENIDGVIRIPENYQYNHDLNEFTA